MEPKPLSEWYEDQEGVSPVIAVILMVAITVVLAAVVYTWASGLAETGEGGGTPSSCSQGEGNFLQMESDLPRQTIRDEPEYRMTDADGTVYLGATGGSSTDGTEFNWSWSPGALTDDIEGGDSLSIDDRADAWTNGDRFDFAIRDNSGALAQCKFTWSA